MTAIGSHFVFATTASYSHCPPVINLSLALLESTPDLATSVILHQNNEERAQQLIQDVGRPVVDRLRLWPVGEKGQLRDASASYMHMVYKSGEVYGAILASSTPWPTPSVFVFDITSFFYVMIKQKVEENFPRLKPPKLVAYNPQNAFEILYHAGAVENGSLRWVEDSLNKADQEAMVLPDIDKITTDHANGNGAVHPDEERQQRLVKAYRECVTESDKIVDIPGYPPFHLYERWSVDVDWSSPMEAGWFQYLAGLQASSLTPGAWIGAFPSSILEPETLDVVRKDPLLTNGGEKPYFELGWYEPQPLADWGEGVRAFLDKYEEKEVVYISFGTVVEAGFGLPTIFEYLEETKTPYIYACGDQKDRLPENVKAILTKAEAEGLCIAPDWVDQIGVLSHKSIGCFVSHCGINSTLEALVAGVPLICWGRRWDQIQLSSLIHAQGLGVELLQHRSGHAIGRQVAHREGVVVKGEPAALKSELKAAFAAVKGPKGTEMRRRIKVFQETIKEKKAGEWKDAVKAFGQYGRG